MLAGMPVYPRHVIRELLPTDYTAAFRVMSAVYPHLVQTETGFLHRMESMPPEARWQGWVAEVEGSVVGWSRANIRYEESGGSANIGVVVLPEWRRRGIGSALHEPALAHVADAPRAFAFAGEDGRAFAETHGYRLTRTSRTSSLDPRTVDTSDLDTASVDVRRLSEIGPEATFAVESVTALDVPGDEPHDQIEFDLWKRRYWHDPDLDFTSSFGACVDDRLVAVSYVGVDLPGDRAVSAYTGTLPEYRGRGLARLAKLATIRRLNEVGISRLVAYNHDENAAMLAINERLGFRPVVTQYFYVREGSAS